MKIYPVLVFEIVNPDCIYFYKFSKKKERQPSEHVEGILTESNSRKMVVLPLVSEN